MLNRTLDTRSFLLIAWCGLAVCGFQSANAQTARPKSSDALQQLLLMPAPPPRTPVPDAPNVTPRSRQFYDKNSVPRDDAPTLDLVDYWEHWANAPDRDAPRPSAAAARRLLDACSAEPAKLQQLLPLLPQTAQTGELVKKLYDEGANNQLLEGSWHDDVHKWLLFHTAYFRDELATLARKARDKNGYVFNSESKGPTA